MAILILKSSSRLHDPFQVLLNYDKKWLLFLRCMIGVVSYGCLALSVGFIPLAFAQIIQNTNTFWTALLAFYILGDPLRSYELIGMVGCFAGILVMVVGNHQ
jgi:drug/metabolite transporter (DMT)-like permease